MKSIKTGIKWIDDVLPDGLPIKTSTIISGPGGSGKPLIGETYVAAWLKQNGSVIFMSLQYPNPDFLALSIKNITGLDLNDYKEKIIFIQLNTEIEDLTYNDKNIIQANLVKPDVWEKALRLAKEKLSEQGPGILVFGSALNLLLFSPTYGNEILNKIKDTISNDKSCTYMFAVSTSAKKEEITQLEKVADNLIMTYSEKQPFRLYIKVVRVKNLRFKSEEILVPIESEKLSLIKEEADHSRKVVIPAISKI